ncbi:FkbM family methyltransferase [Thermodesulfobacteriota bacterium]
MNPEAAVSKVIRAGFRALGWRSFEKPSTQVVTPQNPSSFALQREILPGPEDPVIFDVGANVGQTTQRYLEHFPESTIYSFEPFPECFNHIQDLFRDNQRVLPQQLALSDSIGNFFLHVQPEHRNNSLLPFAYGASHWITGRAETTKMIEVTTTTVDEFCRDRGIDRIGILKMDIQGGELRTLMGAKGMLKGDAIDLIYTEVLLVDIYEGQGQFWEIGQFLVSLDYKLFNLYSQHISRDGRLKWADALFVRGPLVDPA